MMIVSSVLASVLIAATPVPAGFGEAYLAKPQLVLTQQRRYILGPRGGCYYINRNGNRTYVDRNLCARR